MHRVSDVIELQELSLLSLLAILSNSRTSSFYRHVWDNQITQRNLNGKGKSLLDRVQATCTQRAISLIKYIYNEDYAKKDCKGAENVFTSRRSCRYNQIFTGGFYRC